jgi:glycerate dehydrogenase
MPNLKYIGVSATGYNIVDIEAARAQNVVVCNVPSYSSDSVVQLTFSLIFEIAYRVQQHSESVHNGDWAASEHFSYTKFPIFELAGKTLGIIGFGEIGQKVADVATALGMNVIAHSRTITDQSKRQNFKWVSQKELLEQSDFISLHCPLFLETKEIIDKTFLAKMKPTAYLINTSRGGLVNEKDLADALNYGIIAGAGLDVLTVEPPKADNPLLTAKNCLITPHIAWATKEARTRLLAQTAENIKAFMNGKPVNVVN